MKDRWETRNLGDVCQVIGGGTPSKDNAAFYGGDIPWATVRDLRQDVIFETEFMITKEAVKSSSTNIIPKGNVVIATRVGLGKISLLGQDTAINQDLRGIVPNDPKVISVRFLFWWLKSIAHLIEEEGTGATVKGVKLPFVKSLRVPLPLLPEQQRIVGILDEAFDGIAIAKANAEKNLQNARALFESHLQSVFTQRGEGWVEKSVGELVAEGTLIKPFDGNHGEIHPRKADYTDSGVPFIMACDLQSGRVDTEHCTFIKRKLAESLRVGFAKDGDVLISHKGTIGRSAIVSTEDDYIMLTPQVTSYRVKDPSKLFNRFIRYYFMSPVFQREMTTGAADGSTRAYIGITKQLLLHFHFPSLVEQKRIAAELDVIDPETQRLESLYQRKLAALDELKKSLLHQAFAGQLTQDKRPSAMEAATHG